MTDITDLAKEIITISKSLSHDKPNRLMPLATRLAQMVCNDTPSRCFYRGYELGVKEQKEKDAQIVEARGKEIGGAIDPVRIAKAIREE